MNDDQTDISEKLGHEPPLDVNTRGVAMSGAALIGSIFLGLLLVGGLVLVFSKIYGGAPDVAPPTTAGIPGTPPPDARTPNLKTLRATENKLLTEYAWIDDETGIARIPIARAMEIIAERTEQSAE
jgi:hypothetical protein